MSWRRSTRSRRLNETRRSSNPWVHREAGNLLMLIADERDQVAAHDGEVAT